MNGPTPIISSTLNKTAERSPMRRGSALGSPAFAVCASESPVKFGEDESIECRYLDYYGAGQGIDATAGLRGH